MLSRHNLKIIDYNFINDKDKRGNSMTILATTNESSLDESKLVFTNMLDSLKKIDPYNVFADKINKSHKKLKKYIINKNNQNLTIAGYGAAGRGVDTCVIAGITKNDLIAIYDKNPFFDNKEMPVSRIPVKNPDTLFKDNPDELIVFSYGYIDEIKTYYSNYDGKIISMLDIMNSK